MSAKFCHNPVCPQHTDVSWQILTSGHMHIRSVEGATMVKRHEYITLGGKQIYLCDTCFNAVRLLQDAVNPT